LRTKTDAKFSRAATLRGAPRRREALHRRESLGTDSPVLPLDEAANAPNGAFAAKLFSGGESADSGINAAVKAGANAARRARDQQNNARSEVKKPAIHRHFCAVANFLRKRGCEKSFRRAIFPALDRACAAAAGRGTYTQN
jgi:hypothetical protein